MLPAIDMINHATEPEKRKTVLRRSTAEATVKVDGVDINIKGFFTMKAGQASMLSDPYLFNGRVYALHTTDFEGVSAIVILPGLPTMDPKGILV